MAKRSEFDAAAISIAPYEKIEDLQCDGLKIIVRRDGFRYGTDSILLANFVKAARPPVDNTSVCGMSAAKPQASATSAGMRPPGGADIVELCSGSGVVSILLSAKTRASRIVGIEIQAPLAAMANRSAAMNAIDSKVAFINGDIRDIRNIMGAGSAGAVVANPPYLKRGSGEHSPDDSAAIAKHEIYCELADVTSAAGWLLSQGGSFYIVYRPERMVDLFCAMRASGIEPKEMQPAGRQAGAPPSLILVRGIKGAAPGLRYLCQITT
ncbi:MAG: methyltransferase [Oscillospiraceae bacterium]|nr:methyltransferase [Oscillospiraceae bacterium]